MIIVEDFILPDVQSHRKKYLGRRRISNKCQAEIIVLLF